jgi:membrane protein YqaA with SNARE-associated domain
MILEAFISNLVLSMSYFGVLISSALVSASIIFPLPWYMITLGAVFLKLNPLLTALMFAIGSMAGEIICYKIGTGGKKLVENKFKLKKSKKLMKLTKVIEKYFKQYGFLTIFVTALIIFPFDIVSIVAGLNGYDIKKYLLAGFMGKFLKMLIVMLLTIKGISYLGFLM